MEQQIAEKVMDTLRKIAETLYEKNSIFIFPHVNMDGDALGSSSALCSALRKLGKTAYILTEEDTAYKIRFLDRGDCVRVDGAGLQVCGCASENGGSENRAAVDIASIMAAIGAPDVCICVDCGSTDRFAARAGIFALGAMSMCIDHHVTSEPIFDMNYIDGGAAATGEIVYDLIKELETVSGCALLDKEIGEAVFAAIATDTGNFQYSNTTAKSHRIAAELLELGTDENSVCIKIYQNAKISGIRLNAAAVNKMKLFAGGEAAVAVVTQELLNFCDAEMSEADGIVETMRNIRGVEISVLLKEYKTDEIKVSMRAKAYANVAAVAAKFGGGGHIRAAGCTLKMNVSEAEKVMMEAVSEALRKETE